MEFNIRQGKREDCMAVHQLIRELAIYERAEEEFVLSLDQLVEDGFGENPIYFLFVAELNNEIIGVAISYEKYSTWKGRCIYLEDLIVTEKYRGIGAGKSLFEAVIKEASNRNAGRMEWQVLDWNEPAIDFYKSYKAELDNEWINGRFRNEQLNKMVIENEGI